MHDGAIAYSGAASLAVRLPHLRRAAHARFGAELSPDAAAPETHARLALEGAENAAF